METKNMENSLEGYFWRMDLDTLYKVCQMPEKDAADGVVALAKEIYKERTEKKEK